MQSLKKMFLDGLKDILNWNALLRKTTINQMVMPYNTILERSILDVLYMECPYPESNTRRIQL